MKQILFNNAKSKDIHHLSSNVHMFLCVFFSVTDELVLALRFIKQKIGNYEYFSNNIRYDTFPLKNELFSVFYTGNLLKHDEVYYGKILGISSPMSKKKLPQIIRKITKFQKQIWSQQYYQIPIQLGYLSGPKVVSIYKEPSFISIDNIKGLHHQTELNYSHQSPYSHIYSLSIFKTKDYLTFFDDFHRIVRNV